MPAHKEKTACGSGASDPPSNREFMLRSSNGVPGPMKNVWRVDCKRVVKRKESLSECSLDKAGDLGLLHFTRGVVKRGSRGVEHDDVRNVAFVILLAQLLLRGREWMVQVNDDKLHVALIFFVQAHGAASLTLRVVAALSVQDDIGRLSGGGAIVHAVSRDQGAVLAVAGVVELGI